MPIFEFRCLKCGNLFEKIFINMNEKADIECSYCQSKAFERIISRTNYIIGPGKNSKKTEVTTRSCSPGSNCMTLEIPGPGE